MNTGTIRRSFHRPFRGIGSVITPPPPPLRRPLPKRRSTDESLSPSIRERVLSFLAHISGAVGDLQQQFVVIDPSPRPRSDETDSTKTTIDGEDQKPFLHYWVIRKGRSWPAPEQYLSVVLPHEYSGEMEILLAAFVHKRHAVSACEGYKKMKKTEEMFVDHVSIDYLRKAPLLALGVAVFDDDISRLDPCFVMHYHDDSDSYLFWDTEEGEEEDNERMDDIDRKKRKHDEMLRAFEECLAMTDVAHRAYSREKK